MTTRRKSAPLTAALLTVKHLREYTPRRPRWNNGTYLQGAAGEDWYDVLKTFRNDTLKVGYHRDGRIVTFGREAALMWPAGMSVSEVLMKDVPADLSLDGCWYYREGCIVPGDEGNA